MPATIPVTMAVEGPIDEAIAQVLIRHVGGVSGRSFGMRGKGHLRPLIPSLSEAARHAPWLIITDLDTDAECAPLLLEKLHKVPITHFCLRIAVHETEAWLMADRTRLAEYLSVSETRIPMNPETENDPKQLMVNIARRSKKRLIREGMVPRPESGRVLGAMYTALVIEFVQKHWNPEEASKRSDSLRRAIRCLKKLVNR